MMTAEQTERRGPGRPALPPDRVLCHRVDVWIDADTFDWLVQETGARSTLSTFLRSLVKRCRGCERDGGCDGSCGS